MISGGILAGGAGRRFGGQNKALLELAGKPLIAHVAERLRPRVSELLISSGAHGNALSDFADCCLPDPTGFMGLGPIAGILALLQGMRGEWLLVLPCDAPLFPEQAMEGLLACAGGDFAAAVVRVNGQINPVCCMLNRDCAGPLEAALRQGQRRSTEIMLSLSPTFVDHDDDRPGLWSLNTPAELAACEGSLAG